MTGAGTGEVEVVIQDPMGQKGTVEPQLEARGDSMYRCSYQPSMEGVHTVHVTFAGVPIPRSPYTVTVGQGRRALQPGPTPGPPGLCFHCRGASLPYPLASPCAFTSGRLALAVWSPAAVCSAHRPTVLKSAFCWAWGGFLSVCSPAVLRATPGGGKDGVVLGASACAQPRSLCSL